MTTEKEIYVGAVVEINQKQINLVPNTPINQIDERGLKLALDKPLELGTFGDAINSICKDVGVENPLSEAKVEEYNITLFKNAVTKLKSANMRIEALEYDKPPTQKNGGKIPKEQQDSTKYLFVASVNWKDDDRSQNGESSENEETDFFKLKGLILGISSGYTDTTGENTAVQKAFQSALQAMNVPALQPSIDVEAQKIEVDANNKLDKSDNSNNPDKKDSDTSSDKPEEKEKAETADSE